MTMIRKTLGAWLLLLPSLATAGERTVVSAEVYGHKGETVRIDCVQTPFIKAEFHNNPGERHTYAFEAPSEPLLLIVAGKAEVLLGAGDSVHVVVRMDGRNADCRYSGTPGAVAANELRARIAGLRREMRYKGQLLACAVVDVKPDARVADAKELLAKVGEMAGEAKGKAPAGLLGYATAEQEASAYLSFMEYPKMYEEMRKTPIAEQGIGDYHAIMDGREARSDAPALACPEYASFLMRYCDYRNGKEAAEAGRAYSTPETLEEMYAAFKAFYIGGQRDCVLFHLLSNHIRGGKQTERALPLYEDYKRECCTDKEHARILGTFMQ